MTYDSKNINSFCDILAARDSVFQAIIDSHGYPAITPRKPGFPALIRLILEQQVSLMSAKSAFLKLRQKITEIRPENILRLTAEELRQCYFSRQKAVYAKALSQAIVDQRIKLGELAELSDDEIRASLVQIKGIGPWTADNYLLLYLRRTDIFPIGDVALLNSLKKIMRLPKDSTSERILEIADAWRPYRSIAAQLFWHAYIADKKINLAALDYE